MTREQKLAAFEADAAKIRKRLVSEMEEINGRITPEADCQIAALFLHFLRSCQDSSDDDARVCL